MINIKWHDFFKVRPKKEKEILLRLYNSFYIGWLDEDNILCTQEFSLYDEEIENERKDNGGKGIYWSEVSFNKKDIVKECD